MGFGAAVALALGCSSATLPGPQRPMPSGPLQISQDLGEVGVPGSARLLPEGGDEISGGGGDIWWKRDALQFVHSKRSGDLHLQAAIQWVDPSNEPYRKAVLMVRQSTAEGSAYVDVTIHENGEAALQYRPYFGAPTLPFRATIVAPELFRLERVGNAYTATFTGAKGNIGTIGPLEVDLGDTVLVGLGVCSHDAGALTTARFDQVVVEGELAQVR